MGDKGLQSQKDCESADGEALRKRTPEEREGITEMTGGSQRVQKNEEGMMQGEGRSAYKESGGQSERGVGKNWRGHLVVRAEREMNNRESERDGNKLLRERETKTKEFKILTNFMSF